MVNENYHYEKRQAEIDKEEKHKVKHKMKAEELEIYKKASEWYLKNYIDYENGEFKTSPFIKFEPHFKAMLNKAEEVYSVMYGKEMFGEIQKFGRLMYICFAYNLIDELRNKIKGE